MILENITKQDQMSTAIKDIIDNTFTTNSIEREKLLYLIENITENGLTYLEEQANILRDKYYDDRVYLRGLIEISNHCKQACKYCGINTTNKNVNRYRLTEEEILATMDEGYRLGYRTFVVQGGEDDYYTDEILTSVIKKAKTKYDDIAITLSLGERGNESFKKLYDAGADRYLLRHETASKRLYEHLHPNNMSFEGRQQALFDLKEIGYQVGCGFMVNTPTQTNEDFVEDFMFVQKLQPSMCGIGPFLSHSATVFKNEEDGTLNHVRFAVALTRLLIPYALLPATTAVATLDNKGREKILKSAANVVMPNLTPTINRPDYEIYENKICLGDEAAQCRVCIEKRINSFGFIVDMQKGDVEPKKS